MIQTSVMDKKLRVILRTSSICIGLTSILKAYIDVNCHVNYHKKLRAYLRHNHGI